MVRAPFFDSNGTKRGAWSEEEDNKLRAHITAYGHRNWRLVPIFAGLARCGKSCRLRWLNYLRPGLRRGNFTEEEKYLVIRLHDQLGNKWSTIAEHLPGRTDNEVKNYWHARISKHSKRNHGTVNEVVRTTGSSDRDYGTTANDHEEEHVHAHENAFELQGLSAENTQGVDSYSAECDLWNQEYETCYSQYFSVNRPAFTEEDRLHEFGLPHETFSDSSDSGIDWSYWTEESGGSFWSEPVHEDTFDVVLW